LEKLILLLVEAALEVVPSELRSHPAVISNAKRRGKRVDEILLDKSYHYSAMKRLEDSKKRGRPDILHFCLLEALGSPLNHRKRLELFVSTIDGYVIHVNPRVRLPRVYERFKGVMEDLFKKHVIKTDEGVELMRIEKMSLPSLVEKLNPSLRILMSEKGVLKTRKELKDLMNVARPLVMVGCFPHGDFSDETKSLAERVVAVDENPLDAWVVVSRTLCLAEELVS